MSESEEPRPKPRPDPDEKGLRLLRRKVVAEWHGGWGDRDLRHFERKPSELIPGILARWGLQDRAVNARMAAEWPAIVGDFLARHSKPVGMRRGVLEVAVLQPSVRYEMERQHRRSILQKLQERYGEKTVRDVRFLVG